MFIFSPVGPPLRVPFQVLVSRNTELPDLCFPLEVENVPWPTHRRPFSCFSQLPSPGSLAGAFPPFPSLGPCLLLESGGDCLHLLRRQQGNMTSLSGPNPERHWCWLGIKAAVPFLTFMGPHLTLSMCSRHFIVCQGDKQNPPPESREGCLRGSSDPAEADKCFSHPGPPLSTEDFSCTYMTPP